MSRRQAARHEPGRDHVVIPNSGFRGLYSLLAQLRRLDCPEPEARGAGLHVTWKYGALQEDGVVEVSRDGQDGSVEARLHVDGVLEMSKTCTPADVLALRNLAANPERRFRRFGFDTQVCPFCRAHLPHGTLDFGLGHCRRCGELLGWSLDQSTADRAEDDLREDVQQELEQEE